ncbi:aminotransferase class I/II-fold pyridoxal phosphate-dependent enzyme [Falsibacillus pallidus]|uniref:Arginine/lysine/ornithine decarboxylase n=1 Tax=Falsibacillus pallidus TaxID=493781 RepID=A0A370G3D9_9BACI|nr:aminotransferase class I/II-fold pyridoxal phosphate-dependent enzyme [Falsibacillus pallidus]RDI38387.1 arginine/lysine/ornithine decarboxylase [Falsibacillus pallidus]
MNQNQTPLYDALVQHIAKRTVSFHVPGHKNGEVLPEHLHREFKEFLKYDVTEISGLDDFHSPEVAIAESLELLRDLYGSYKSYFLVNGSTVGNLAMILGVCEEGDTVFVQRNCHKSILNALKMANVRPVYLSPSLNEAWHVGDGVMPASLAAAYEKFPDVKACIFTYPNYYGLTYDIKSLIDMAHDHGSYVLVDEAHGAHFQAGSPFPESSLQLGADIVVHSAHKTLPAMTMGSFLHVNHDRLPIDRIEFYLGALQSSSPSYPIMASLDAARHYLSSMSGEDLLYTIEQKDAFVKDLTSIPGIHALSNGEKQDPLKITIKAEGYSGYELQTELEKAGIYVEMADPYQVLFVFPLLKKGMKVDYGEKIAVFKSIFIKRESDFVPVVIRDGHRNPFREQLLSFKELGQRTSVWVPYEEAAGRISAKMVIPYPPGVPLLMPGEQVTGEMIHSLKMYMESGARFQGDHRLLEGLIAVIEDNR